jgi:branched-chain amino acid transport system ATP-binding protein
MADATALPAPPPPTSATGKALLEATGITKRFAGINALDNVSIKVNAGELVALIGPNGAGKTTFFNCLLGILRPDDGEVIFGGTDLARLQVHERARLGLGRTFQRIELFIGMTVREHLLVAAQARRSKGAFFRDLVGMSRPNPEDRELCEATLELVGLTEVADRPAESLSLGRGRLVELARALMCQPTLLFLDEPSSGLDHRETDEMCQVMTTVQAERGTAILLVEHDVPMVEKLAQRCYVIDVGRMIAEGPTSAVLAEPQVRAAYLGQGV